jgi:hypothetical protein
LNAEGRLLFFKRLVLYLQTLPSLIHAKPAAKYWNINPLKAKRISFI